MMDLHSAGKLLEYGGLAAPSEYLKALLEVQIAIFDHLTTNDTPSAAPAKPADSRPRKGKAD